MLIGEDHPGGIAVADIRHANGKPNVNPYLVNLSLGHSGRVRRLTGPGLSVSRKMAFDPKQSVSLTDHGTMTLRSAVAQAMILPLKERVRATIVRKGKPKVLRFEQIKDLAVRWEKRLERTE